MVFTTRLAGGTRRPQRASRPNSRRLGVTQKNSRPNHPTTCGKVERFQQTMKNWLRAQPDQPATIAELQALLDTFVDDYNHRRPHRSLPHRATPATAYTSPPQSHPRRTATPTPTTGSATTASTRPATSPCASTAASTTSASARTHAGTPVIMLVHDLDIRIINAATGELLRDLTLDPTPRLPAATTKPRNSDPQVRPVSDLLRDHMAVAVGFEPTVDFHPHTLSRRAP